MVLHALFFDNPQALRRAIAPPFQADHGDSSISSEPITLLRDGLQLRSLATSWGRSSSPRLCSTTLYTSRLATRPRAKRLQRRYISQKDITYLSLGIFFAHLSSIYGESAFERLLLEIAARPHEISVLNSGWVGDCSDQLLHTRDHSFETSTKPVNTNSYGTDQKHTKSHCASQEESPAMACALLTFTPLRTPSPSNKR